MDEYRLNNHVVYSCKYHVIWCPKYRRKVLEPPIDARFKQIIAGVCEETGSEVVEMEIMPDHVHLLVGCDPQFGIHRLVSDDPPELVPQTFVDPELAEVHTDRLYRVRLLDGRPALIYALVEHKSWLDPRVGLQLLRYLVRVLEWADAEAKGKGPLPAVVPLVVYHGKPEWPGPGRFLSLVDTDEALAPYLLDFRYEVADLGRVDDEALSRHVELRLGLLLLKHVFLGTDLGQLLDEEMVATLQRDRDFLAMLIRYLLRVVGREKRPMIIDMVSRVYPGQGEAVVASYGEELINEGKRLGFIEGEAEGVTKGKRLGVIEGKAELLLAQMRRRFGPVPEPWRQVVLAAAPAQLDAWADAIFDAASIEALLASRPH